jgi:Family of unknown function (DUF6325)
VEDEVTIGPVEYVIVGFPENRFTGEIAPALADLIRNRSVRVIDLVFIAKDADGEVEWFEFNQPKELTAFAELNGGGLSVEDIQYTAASLAPNSSARLLVWEDLSAVPMVEAPMNADGVVIEGSRIPHDLAEWALAALGRAG